MFVCFSIENCIYIMKLYVHMYIYRISWSPTPLLNILKAGIIYLWGWSYIYIHIYIYIYIYIIFCFSRYRQGTEGEEKRVSKILNKYIKREDSVKVCFSCIFIPGKKSASWQLVTGGSKDRRRENAIPAKKEIGIIWRHGYPVTLWWKSIDSFP